MYDIDKAYIMGHGFDANGVYIGWSSLFDYTSLATIQASEQLPMPKRVSLKADKKGIKLPTENLEVAINELKQLTEAKADPKLIELAKIKKINSLVLVLNALNKIEISYKEENSKLVKLPININVSDEILLILKAHESSVIPRSNKSTALKNFIASHIEGVILDIRNAVGAYSPIEMDVIRDASKNSPKGEEALRKTLMNPVVVYQMQFENMTGKTVIGIAANGEKGSFMWHYYLNDLMQNIDMLNLSDNDKRSLEYAKFKFNTTRIIGRASKDWKPEARTITTLPDINPNINPEVFLELTGPDGLLIPKLKVDLMISQVLSAATDNAKELILAKINSGSKLAKVYLYLITLGLDCDDIVSFMTCPTVSFIDKLTESNVFNDYDFSEKDALLIAKGIIPSKLLRQISPNEAISKNQAVRSYLLSESDDLNIPDPSKNSEGLVVNWSKHYAFEEFILILKSIKTLRKEFQIDSEDVAEFENVLEGANEFTSFTGVLSFNLGFGTQKTKLQASLNKITLVITSREEALGITSYGKPLQNSTDPIANDLLNNATLLERYKDVMFGKFDVLKWLRNESVIVGQEEIKYQDLVAEYYDIIKKTINVFEIVPKLPLYNALLKILDTITEFDKNSSTVKTSLFEKIRDEYKENGHFVNLQLEDSIIKFIDGLMIKDFIINCGIKVPVPKGTLLMDDFGSFLKPRIADGNIILNSVTLAANFKYYFETKIIPMLKLGKYWNGKEVILDSKIETNLFILDLIVGRENEVPLYKCNINMLSKDNSLESTTKFTSYLRGLMELKNIKLGDTSLTDLFILYNLIVNKNNYGANRLTTLFANFVNEYSNTSLLNKYFNYIGKLDWKLSSKDIAKQFNYSFLDVLIANARAVKSTKGCKLPCVYTQTPTGPQYFIFKNGGYVELEEVFPKNGEESDELKLDRIGRFKSYFTLSSNFATFISKTQKLLKNIKGNEDNVLFELNRLVQLGILEITKQCE